MNANCKKDNALQRDLLIATIPTLLAILVQKGLDEVSNHFARKRHKAKQQEKANNDDTGDGNETEGG